MSTRRFGVAWRNAVTGVTSPVGVLEAREGLFRFWYRGDVRLVDGFRAFIGFRDLEEVYVSSQLFPLFAVRVMDRRRADYRSYVTALGLDVTASPLDVLSRNGGDRKGDQIQVAEEPQVEGARTRAVFLASGLSYAVRQFGSQSAADNVRAGDELSLVRDVSNPVDPRALLVRTMEGQALGWVPALLLDYAEHVCAASDTRVTVLRSNGVEFPWHLRLLVQADAPVLDGYRGFSGPDWEPAGSFSAL